MSNNIRNQPMYLVTGDPETENNPTLLYPGSLGSRLTIKEPGVPGSPTTAGQYRHKTYQLVQSDSSMTTNPFKGAVAWWSDKTKFLVTTSPTTLGRGRVAGIFRGNVTPGNFCFVQTQGPCPNVKFIDAPTSIPDATGLGTFVIPSATAGKADNLAAGSAATYPILGLSAGTWNPGDNTATVDLDVPETP
jgi:hypothetical protein